MYPLVLLTVLGLFIEILSYPATYVALIVEFVLGLAF